MNSFPHITRCFELTEEDIAGAVESRDDTRALLAHLAAISEPNAGAAKALLVFARMATSVCEWLDGDLRIEIVGDDDVSVVEALDDLGGGMRERLFQPLAFKTPLVEFSRAIERVPHMVAPLTILAQSERRITLGATAEIRRSSLPPPAVKIAEDSFFMSASTRMKPLAEFVEHPGAGHSLPIVAPQLPLVVSESRSASGRRSSRPPRKSSKPPQQPIAPPARRIMVAKRVAPPGAAPAIARPPKAFTPQVAAAMAAITRPAPTPGPIAPPKQALLAPTPTPIVKAPAEPPRRDPRGEPNDVDSGWDDT